MRQLRGPVTATVCRLLPGADRATGMRWLFATENTLTAMVAEITGMLHPQMPKDHLNGAALAVGMLYPITDELQRRHDRRAEIPLSRCRPSDTVPTPSGELLALRPTAEQLVGTALSPYHPYERWQQMRQPMTDPILGLIGDSTDLAWGAWTTFAAAMALYLHKDELPEPGRTAGSRRPGPARDRAVDVGLAFQLGRMILLNGTLGLLDLADQSRA